MTRAALEDQFADKIRLLDQVEENLYTSLSSFTDGEAWSIASNTPEGHGLEAYRHLCFRFLRPQFRSTLFRLACLLQQSFLPSSLHTNSF